jgi:hypothetical protein
LPMPKPILGMETLSSAYHTPKFLILGCEYKTLNKINILNICIKLVKVNLSFCRFRYRKVWFSKFSKLILRAFVDVVLVCCLY